MSSLRSQVLQTYKQIVKMALDWPRYKAQSIHQSIKMTPMSKTGQSNVQVNDAEIEEEKKYIVNEARALFRLNKNVSWPVV